ncbi:hypothetical protein LTR62_001114 [Meristemomyces frigidus]|uniref:Cleavage and polyadenylation specificity factor subunit 2 n=1 Tax=Meristemomyces frigidus TaxID=1508187 RepID=A0AAN7YQM3_9PEZI|nr:hypothetical protein LTR62_001114 [Meristemomyces frigidus]
MFNFTPLLGARAESAASQSLLELDGGVKILVDVGWDDAFKAARLEALSEHVSTLSLILLTHPTIEHLGAYAYCCKNLPLFAHIPVYATIPVINLGRTLLSDLYSSTPLAASILSSTPGQADVSPNLLLDAPTEEEISSYFDHITSLKYSQPHQPIASTWSPPLDNLTITAYGAGHSLGGTIWHIQHSLESIVFANDWNQGRENLLPGAAFLSGSGQEILEPLQRPTALICAAKGVERGEILARKDRDAALISLVRETVAAGGKVLIPTDSSARMLEIAFLLNETWREGTHGPYGDTFRSARVYMASKTATTTVKYMKNMLEWVEESVRADAEAAMTKGKGQQGQAAAGGPLDWKHVRALEKRGQVEQVLKRQKPCVLLTSDRTLEWGFARQGFKVLAEDGRNLVVLTEEVRGSDRVQKGLGRQLWERWREGQRGGNVKIVEGNGSPIEYGDTAIKSLSDDELAVWETYQARQRQLHSTIQGDHTLADSTGAEIADTQAAADEDAGHASDSDEEDEDSEHQGRALNMTAQLTQSQKRQQAAEAITDGELGVNVLLRAQTAVHDYEVRGKKGREKVFPFVAKRSRFDIFGELIRGEEFLRAEEKDAGSGENAVNGTAGDRGMVGGKRKWSELPVGGKGGKSGRQQFSKRAKMEDGRAGKKGGKQDDIDAAIALATGEGTGPGAAEEDESELDDESDYEPEDLDSGPKKVVFISSHLSLNMRIAHVDFSGLCSMRALQMIVPLVRPKKVILTSGTESEVMRLAEVLRPGVEGTEVLTPREGEVVEAGGDSNAWSLKLSRALVKKLTWQNVKGLGVVALTGRLSAEVDASDVPQIKGHAAGADSDLKAEDDTETPKRKKARLLDTESDNANNPTSITKSSTTTKPAELPLPILDLPCSLASLATAQPTTQRPTRPVHVGDLRLASLREILSASGHSAVFAGEGTLLVNGVVIVRKSGARIELECAVRGLDGGGRGRGRVMGMGAGVEGGGTFGAVKRAVYGGLAVVAGV